MNNSGEIEIPHGNARGFRKYFKQDIISGLLVFLLALPLCLGISIASGYPPLAGIFTAIIGAMITTCISNSELTIKGPAAGMIMIALGCIEDFGGNGMTDKIWSATDTTAYRAALAVGVAAAVLQILFATCRAGILGEFFPSAAVHGMLAAIGVTIIVKQFPVAIGVTASGAPLKMLQQIPTYISQANPAIAAIGIAILVIMFVWPTVRAKVSFLRSIPAPLIVLLVAVPMGMFFELTNEHSYTFGQSQVEYKIDESFLVAMPKESFGMFKEVMFPDFQALKQAKAWWWVTLFFIIGSLESLLSAKAVDLLDPYKRKANMDRDILAVGVANLAASFVGGLPMISEIVRSKANIDNGAKTRFADFWHGIFLLLCVALIPMVLHMIPMAALAAMLVYTGFRLAHPNEFVHVYRIGKEQLAIFVTTLIVVLATDLLIGVAAGVLLKMVIHVANGVSLKSLFKPYIEVQEVDSNTSMIIARESAVFSNWIPFRRQIEEIGLVQKRNLIIDLSDTQLVDHNVMAKLEEMERNFEMEGLKLEIRGLDQMNPQSADAHAERRKGMSPVRRLTVVIEESMGPELERAFVECGATGYTVMPCEGAGKHDIKQDIHQKKPCVRIEVVATREVCEAMLKYLSTEVLQHHHVTACIETVSVMRIGDFERSDGT